MGRLDGSPLNSRDGQSDPDLVAGFRWVPDQKVSLRSSLKIEAPKLLSGTVPLSSKVS